MTVHTVKREAGESPARSRRCNGEAFPADPLDISGKEGYADEPESEDLPVFVAPFTLRSIGGV